METTIREAGTSSIQRAPDARDLRLDCITELAIKATGARVGGVSLIFQSQMWMPSRFGGHLMVETAQLRHYAGVMLRSAGGHRFGTQCLVDHGAGMTVGHVDLIGFRQLNEMLGRCCANR